MGLAVVILAAGRGSRLNSKKFKVLHEVGNIPMLYHLIHTAKQLKPSQIIIVISDKMQFIEKDVNKNFSGIRFCVQKKPLGTADAVKLSIEFLDKKILKVLILYGDTPLIRNVTLKKMILNLDKKKSDMCLLGMKLKDPKHYGRIIMNNEKFIDKVVEYSEASREEKQCNLCNTGVMIFKTEYLVEYIYKVENNNKKREFFLTDMVEIINKINKRIGLETCNFEESLGVNDRNDLINIEQEFQKFKIQELIKKGVTLLDSKNIYLSYDTIIGKDSVIFPNVYFGRNVKIGKNVKVKSFSHIEGAIIKDNCEVGPFARLRPETVIFEEASIGNFVEIKKSNIQKKAKIPHLTYIGDSFVGLNTNIGAGTITCNYDGINKNKTKIGNNCFIGSNTSLIAPLSVGDNSIIGAGSVIKKNVSKSVIIYGKPSMIRRNKKK